MATFLLSGFWHGASWNYSWGLYHGCCYSTQLAGRASSPGQDAGRRPVIAAMFVDERRMAALSGLAHAIAGI
jgi:D-alanyl-lipoteichoic acid acyltransferase DltB (MBOAT superfamily)